MSLALGLLERGLLPDAVVRAGIRRLLRQRLRELDAGARDDPEQDALVAVLDAAPIAIATEAANEQHYEVPAELFRHVLGRHMKYSGGLWPDGVDSLDASEQAMLTLSAERAGLADGQDVLELGCGWGSMTLFMAERFPASRIVGVSNSASQRRFILERAAERGLSNLEILTDDMRRFDVDAHLPGRRFDRVVSIEMFEHMRNYRRLFARIAGWMRDDARCFVHVFCHRQRAYLFEVRDASDWMARHFFTGGTMPSAALFGRFGEHLRIEESWLVPGSHYQRTSEAWLAKMDAHRRDLRPILAATYGAAETRRWWARWRTFFMACAELFGHAGGTEWLVAHYRFVKTGSPAVDRPPRG